jgi:hypothetical protein
MICICVYNFVPVCSGYGSHIVLVVGNGYACGFDIKPTGSGL